MKVSYNWLRELIDVPWDPQELAHRLIMVGLEVAEIIERGVGLDKIVVGQVQSKVKHPQADRLSVCMVDIGTGVVQVVCGAPNVAVGQKVSVVLPGTHTAQRFGNQTCQAAWGGIARHDLLRKRVGIGRKRRRYFGAARGNTNGPVLA